MATLPNHREGDAVMGMLGWQEYAISDGSSDHAQGEGKRSAVVVVARGSGAERAHSLFRLARPLGQPRPGDTVVVSTAAGAVGSAVGQIAKLTGCRTVGLTGGPVKCKLCRDDFGYDEVIDYKSDTYSRPDRPPPVPRGVDVYFDNTAGVISDAVLPQLAVGARVVICGTASVASWDPPPTDRGSSGICSSSGRERLVFLRSIISIATKRPSRDWSGGSVTADCVIAKRSLTELKTAQAQSPNFTEGKTSANGSSIFAIIKLAGEHRERLFVRYWHSADISICAAARPLSGVKRTSAFALRYVR